jgi:hypothetical protein
MTSGLVGWLDASWMRGCFFGWMRLGCVAAGSAGGDPRWCGGTPACLSVVYGLDLLPLAYDPWSMAYGLWSMAYGLWCMVGLWSVFCGLWPTGLQPMVYGLSTVSDA